MAGPVVVEVHWTLKWWKRHHDVDPLLCRIRDVLFLLLLLCCYYSDFAVALVAVVVVAVVDVAVDAQLTQQGGSCGEGSFSVAGAAVVEDVSQLDGEAEALSVVFVLLLC